MKKTILFLILLTVLSPAVYVSAAFFKDDDTGFLTECVYYNKLANNIIQCVLCPRRCMIPKNSRGFCRVRENRNGTLYSLVYGKPVAVNADPIEKKPFFHVYPGTKSFSIATVGCNLACKFCQNWQISQASPEDVSSQEMSPKRVVENAKEADCDTIAYTYTEPAIFYEYMLDIAQLAKEAGIKNVMHSSGFINEEPLRKICKYLTAANIDLKGSSDFYDKFCFGKREDVLRTLEILKEEGIWLEITMLIIPALNDNTDYIRSTCKWINKNLGSDTPVHFSRFWPLYQLVNISPTPVSTLEQAGNIAREEGLKYVYIGNVPGHNGETTYCPNCGRTVIERIGYNIISYNIVDKRCKFCNEEIPGVWKE